MKKIIVLITILTITSGVFPYNPVFGQPRDEMIKKAENLEEGKMVDVNENMPRRIESRAGNYDTTTISVGRRELRVIEGRDTTLISLGNRELRIVEKNGNTSMRLLERDETRPTRSRRFRGNWTGLGIGLNNYVNDGFSTSLGPQDDFMELHAARSWNVNFNFLQYDMTLFPDNIGIVTGLGIEMNNYRFTNNYSIAKENRLIMPVDYDAAGINLDRSRLRTYYITVPLLLEFQSNHSRLSQRAHFSAGVIGGVNIGSNTKVVYRDNSRKYRDKVRDDYYLSPFRYGFTARAGYKSLNLYAVYYPTSLFQKNKGPELYPISIGFSISGY